MPRISKKRKLEWSFFLNDRNRITYNSQCRITFAVPWLGIVLTGIFGSRGSNYVADLLKRLQALGNTTELTTVNEYLSNGAQPAQDTDSATEAG